MAGVTFLAPCKARALSSNRQRRSRRRPPNRFQCRLFTPLELTSYGLSHGRLAKKQEPACLSLKDLASNASACRAPHQIHEYLQRRFDPRVRQPVFEKRAAAKGGLPDRIRSG